MMEEKDLIGKNSNGPKDNIINESLSTNASDKDVVVQDKKISKKKGIFKYINFKLMFLYPGIILSSGWTILNIVKIIGYVD
jgi:hypothetical protein